MLNDTPLSIAAVKPIPVEDVLAELDHFLTRPAKSLNDFVSTIAFDGGVHLFENDIQSIPIFRTHNTSGFNYSYNRKMLAYLRFGTTSSGYFVVQSMILKADAEWVSHYYTADGKYAFSEGPITHQFSAQSELVIEPKCPILNHLYNVAADGYTEANTGKVNVKRIYTIEQLLQRLSKTRPQELSVTRGFKDGAIQDLNDRMMRIERDPVYTWKERVSVFKLIKDERKTVIKTKRRVHRKNILSYTLPIIVQDMGAALTRFKFRPVSNTLGLLDRLFLDPIRWFLGVVRSNMGYSVALAIYSPFTFFFITQPMNPQAMWAVGKVRSAYIDTVDSVKNIFSGDQLISNAAIATGAAATATSSTKETFINSSPINPGQFGILLSGEDPKTNQQSWDERMSNFKAVQIAYEENMPIAPRFGRLEQMETQLNWPLIVESAWLETERYHDFLNFVLSNEKEYQPAFIQYIQAEKKRTEETELYLWDRNIRFILDHPYTMMDQSKEQTQYDYYIGKAFINLRDMTRTLTSRYQGLPIPAGFENINQLAQHFEQDYQKGGSVLDRLKNNSKVFRQNDKLSSTELREYMQRQWEVLYLLQNKAQEASNNGLQLYVWSIRNTIWTIQALYSTKREEASLLSLAFKKEAVVNKLSENPAFQRMDAQYESLFHMMVVEYASIRKEIGESLKNDIESTQRKKIISGVENFLMERDALLKGAKLL